jgi:GAF domain-containing protein
LPDSAESSRIRLVERITSTMDYDLLCAQTEALLSGERDAVANAANFSALVFNEIPRLNWAGFYFLTPGGELVLGPFQGRPACTRLAPGKGVCQAAVQRNETVVVDDVHAFADHIACDSASESEIVVPLRDHRGVYGVFDIDSPYKGRFSAADTAGIERLVAVFLRQTSAREATAS